MAGCNFRCPYCHNHALVLRPEEIPSIPLDHIMSRLDSFRDWIDGVVITGGEPTIHHTLPKLLRVFKEEGFLVKLHTNGSQPDVLRVLIDDQLLDSIAMDLKAPLVAGKYRNAAGIASDPATLKESVRLLLKGSIPYEFHTTVVPSLHTRNDILALAQEVRGGERLIIQGFNPQDPLDSTLKTESPYSLEELEEMAKEARKYVKDCRVEERFSI